MRSPLAVRRPHTTTHGVNWRKTHGKAAKNAVRRMQDWNKSAVLVDPIAEKRRAVLQALAMFIEDKLTKEINEEEKARRAQLKKEKAEKSAKEEAKKKELEKKRKEKEEKQRVEDEKKRKQEEEEHKKWQEEVKKQEEEAKRQAEEEARQKKDKKKVEAKQAAPKAEKPSKSKKMDKTEAVPQGAPKVVEEPVVVVKETVPEAAPVQEKTSGKKNKKNKRASESRISESEAAPAATAAAAHAAPAKEEAKPVEEPIAVVEVPVQKAAPAQEKSGKKNKKNKRASESRTSESEAAPAAAPAAPAKEEAKPVEEPIAVVEVPVQEAAPAQEKSGKKNKKNKRASESRASESEAAPAAPAKEEVKEEAKPVEEPIAVVKEAPQEAAPAAEKSGKKNKKNKKHSESEAAAPEEPKEEAKPAKEVEEPCIAIVLPPTKAEQTNEQEAAPAHVTEEHAHDDKATKNKKKNKNKKHHDQHAEPPKANGHVSNGVPPQMAEAPAAPVQAPAADDGMDFLDFVTPKEAKNDEAPESQTKAAAPEEDSISFLDFVTPKGASNVSTAPAPSVQPDVENTAPVAVENVEPETSEQHEAVSEQVEEEVMTLKHTTPLTTDRETAEKVVELNYGETAPVQKEKADTTDAPKSKSSKKKGKKGRNSNSKTITEPEITILDHDEAAADAEISALNAGTPSPPIQVHEVTSTQHTDATHKETIETVVASAIVDQKDVSPTRFAQNVQALVEKTLKTSHPDVQFDPSVKMQIDVQLAKLAERRPVVEARNVITPLPLQLHISRPSTPVNRERVYKLLPKDILFCSGLMDSHGENYAAMASDARNIYKENARGLQRKIRIFKESPHFQLYLKAKEEGVTVESLLAAEN